jgi:GNAT superfamily N-acetyltransferase
MVKLKPLKLSDSNRSQLETLQKACLPHDAPVFPEEGQFWVGLDETQWVCFCLVKPSEQWVDTAYLARAGVLAAWRGQGLQRRMIRVREAWARKRGYRWMISDTTDNVPSSNNLMRCGYKLIEPSAPWANEISLYWTKRLRED